MEVGLRVLSLARCGALGSEKELLQQGVLFCQWPGLVQLQHYPALKNVGFGLCLLHWNVQPHPPEDASEESQLLSAVFISHTDANTTTHADLGRGDWLRRCAAVRHDGGVALPPIRLERRVEVAVAVVRCGPGSRLSAGVHVIMDGPEVQELAVGDEVKVSVQGQ